MDSAPTVSIGLPVYNGERFLAQTLDSILGQTFSDFELIVSDNASTDATARICEAYAGRDPRLHYTRNERNLGAAPNYNLCFEQARGRYFKWCAHDDLLRPTYLERCVAGLDAHPEAVACHTLIGYIDGEGRDLGVYDTGLRGRDAERVSERFGSFILGNHSSADFFGLIRTAALVGTLLHGNFHNGDRALLAELSLRGKLIQLPEVLIVMRDHADRYSRRANRPAERLAWHDTSQTARFQLPTWRLYREYRRMVRQHVQDPVERRRCHAHLRRWWLVNWNWARLAIDVAAIALPGALFGAERLKQSLFSPSPGPSELRERRQENRS